MVKEPEGDRTNLDRALQAKECVGSLASSFDSLRERLFQKIAEEEGRSVEEVKEEHSRRMLEMLREGKLG